MFADTHTQRTVGRNGGGILVRQFSQTVPFTWSVWVDGVCHGCPRVWVTRNLNQDTRWCGYWFTYDGALDERKDNWPAGTTGQVRLYDPKPFGLALTPVMAFATRSRAGKCENFWLQAHSNKDIRGRDVDHMWREQLRPYSRWPEFFKMARAARAYRDGRGLLDWLREHGVDALPILGKLMDVAPIVREPDPTESQEERLDVTDDVVQADRVSGSQE